MNPPEITRTRWELRFSDASPPIRGDLRVPTAATPTAAVVICHGFKGFREWGFFPPLARAVARAGFAAVSFDFSRNGVGADGRDFSALDLFAENTHSRNVEEIGLVVSAVLDGSLADLEIRSLGLLGHSRGGGEAVLAAEQLPVDALVTWAAISTVRRWEEEQIRRWGKGGTVVIANARTGQQMPMGPGYWRDIEESGEALDIEAAARRLRAPWLIVHGTADESVPVDEARELSRHATAARLHEIDGGGHTFGATHPFAGPTPHLSEATRATIDWFGEHLSATGTGLSDRPADEGVHLP